MTSAAYLLFYRRQSSHPLGGPLLEEIVNEANQPTEDESSQSGSRTESPPAPAGEGMRLDGFSHSNGSSSAYPGAGAIHQAGDGGLEDSGAEELDGIPTATRIRGSNFEDDLPTYSAVPHDGEQAIQSTEMDDDCYPVQNLELIDHVATHNSMEGEYTSALGKMQQPNWKFSTANVVEEDNDADENDVDDNASMRAYSSGGSLRAKSPASSIGEDVLPGFNTHESKYHTPQGSVVDDPRFMARSSPRLGVVEDQDGPVADIMLDEPEDGH